MKIAFTLMFLFTISVLHKYGYLLGVWKCDVNPYGGLVYVKVRSTLIIYRTVVLFSFVRAKGKMRKGRLTYLLQSSDTNMSHVTSITTKYLYLYPLFGISLVF